MKRRNFIAAAPAAMLPMPAIAAPEHPNVKVRRLAKEVRATLADPAYLGFGCVLITRDLISYFDEEPNGR